VKDSSIRAAWAQKKCALNGWLTIGSPFTAEIMAHVGWDSLTIDVQHGLLDYGDAVGMMQAIATTGTATMVRVPWNEPAAIMKALDAGASGIICPMVSTAAEAKRFADACRYPPAGYRSLGPVRAALHFGADYVAKANDVIVSLAMIETLDGLNNLDAIVATPGLDGIYIGPADLSFALGLPGALDPTAPNVVAAIDKILAACHKAGKRCGIHTGSVSYAKAMIAKGFDIVSIQADSRILSDAAKSIHGQLR
jgi:4-hydroxy-2-oxoheptanedioate aldolase